MPLKQNSVQQNFSGGELSPQLAGRFDLGIYYNGASWLQNFIGTVQGMARFRAGSKFVWNTRGNAVANLIPFEFNTEQSYILEFTDTKMRIHRNGGLITDTGVNITGITQANPAVVTASSHGFSNGDAVVIQSVVGMTEVNNQEYRVANVTTNTFELQDQSSTDIDATGFTAYSSGGTVAKIIEVTSPYTEAQLFEIDYAQTADTMYITHPSYAPYKLTRSSHTAWTLTTYSRTADPFGSSDNYPSVVTFFEQRLVMAATNNDQQKIWFSKSASYDDFTTGTGADDALSYTIASGKVNRIRWMEGTEDFLAIGTAGSEFKAQGGGTEDAITPTNISIKPPSFYGSAEIKPIRLDSHILYIQRDSLTTRSFEFDAIQDGYTSINRNLTSDEILLSMYGEINGAKQIAYQAGQPSIAWMVRNDGILTSLTFEPREQVNGWSRHLSGGSLTGGKLNKPKYLSVATIPQEQAPDQVYTVVERTVDSSTVRYIEYFADQPNIPRPLDYFTGFDNQESDNEAYLQDLWEAQKRLFYVDSGLEFDGTVSQTGSLDDETVGTGRTFTAGGATFAGTSDDVGREIWGKDGGRAKITAHSSTTVCTVEVLVAFPSASIASGEWYFTNNSFGGLQHLEGESIAVLADGGVIENKTVTNGTISTANQHSYVIAGLGYIGIFRSMDVEVQTESGGSGVTKEKSVNKIGAKLLDTLGARFGTDIYNLDKPNYRSTADKTSRPPPLFSGVMPVEVNDKTDDEKFIYCVQDKPLPCNLQLYSSYIQVSEG